MRCTCEAEPNNPEVCNNCLMVKILDRCEELYWATEDPGGADGRGQGLPAGDALEEIRYKLKKLRKYL